MNASFIQALSAAREAASAQHYPASTLYIVATPIGNLCDITLRALHVLQLVESVACEDTRHTQTLLRAYGIDKQSSQLLALHQHNELEASQILISKLQKGERVAYVSDAGTPGISDPGARLVAAVRAAGLGVIPLPGTSSITTALSVAGIEEPQDQGFVFAGFLPSKAAERGSAIDALGSDSRAIVLLEAPHRIEALANALAVLNSRRVTVCRELTKQFEEVATVAAADLAAWLSQDPNRARGEFVLVLHPRDVDSESQDTYALKTLTLLMAELPLKTAVKLSADITGASRNVLYEAALKLKNSAEKSPTGRI